MDSSPNLEGAMIGHVFYELWCQSWCLTLSLIHTRQDTHHFLRGKKTLGHDLKMTTTSARCLVPKAPVAWPSIDDDVILLEELSKFFDHRVGGFARGDQHEGFPRALPESPNGPNRTPRS